MLSSLPFGSFLIYAPRGQTSSAHNASTFVKVQLKQNLRLQDGLTASEYAALRMHQELAPEHELRDLFAPDAVLVPVPRSSPIKKNSLWPALHIAEALVAHGFGALVRPCLDRRLSIKRSSLGFSADTRPGPEDHVRTIFVRQLHLGELTEVVLVDDVITRGATLLGCAEVLRISFPELRIRAFAMVRTMSDLKDVPSMIEPATGCIQYSNRSLRRFP